MGKGIANWLVLEQQLSLRIMCTVAGVEAQSNTLEGLRIGFYIKGGISWCTVWDEIFRFR